MFCANCRVIMQICSKSCEQGHCFCGSCSPQVNENCILCSGLVINTNTYGNYPEYEPYWVHQVMSPPGVEGEYSSGDDCLLKTNSHEAVPTNLLYARGDAFLRDSRQNSESDNLSVLHSDLSQYVTTQMKFEKSGTPLLEKTDTRQHLLDRTRQEIRNEITKTIYTPFESNPRSHINSEGFTHIKQFQTVGVSTESTPKLISESGNNSATPKENVGNRTTIAANPFTADNREFLVMNVDTNDVTNPQIVELLKNKNSLSSMDFRLQQVIGTILESVTMKPLSANKEEQQLCKLLCERFPPMPVTKLKEIISSIQDEGENYNVVPCCQKDSLQEPSINTAEKAYSRRAFYSPPNGQQSAATPNPQFQPICIRKQSASSDPLSKEAIDAATLNIPRSPVICPISTCKRAFFVSDFTKHIAVDHIKVPRERICPHQCKNFFLDPKLMHFGVSRCQVLLLVKDKIKNLGHERFKDYIPVLVMASKVSLLELCCSEYRPHSDEVQNSKQNFFMIWLTGLIPPELPIYFSLTVWARSGCIPICHIVHSGQLYSVRNSQSPDAVHKSGQRMLLSENQIDLLTNKGRHLLELQVLVH